MENVTSVVVNFWAVLGDMAPYLLFGFLVAGALSVLIPTRLVERHLGGPGLLPVVKASLFGVPLPLCSCSVIPVSASLRKSGASKGATTAFLISSPQTGVDSILVTLSLLGPIYAVFRPVAAFFAGLAGGWLVTLLAPDEPTKPADPSNCDGPSCCAAPTPREGKTLQALRYGLVTLPRDLGWSLVIGLAIAGAIAVALPEDFFAEVLGTGLVAMVVMMLAGLPVYVCATASVPVAAALIAKGVSPGAALVFLMTGPATNAATIMTVWKFLGRRTAVIYLVAVAGTALLSGVMLDYIFRVQGTVPDRYMPWMIPGVVRTGSAIVLLVILGYALLWPKARRIVAGAGGNDTERLELSVKGMTCKHCAEGVRHALEACGGVASAVVDLTSGTAVIRGRGFDRPALLRAVRGLGYEAGSSTRLGDRSETGG